MIVKNVIAPNLAEHVVDQIASSLAQTIWTIILEVFHEDGIVGFSGISDRRASFSRTVTSQSADVELTFHLTTPKVVMETNIMVLPPQTEKKIRKRVLDRLSDSSVEIVFDTTGHDQDFIRKHLELFEEHVSRSWWQRLKAVFS